MLLALVVGGMVYATAAPAGRAQGDPSPSTTTTTTTSTTRPPAPGQAGAYAVGTRTFDFVDSTRDADVDGRRGPRALPTLVRYPARSGGRGAPPASGAFPLIVFAPGYLQCRASYAPLLDTWASAGFVVAAVEFPLTNCHLGAGADENDIVNQPADLSFVIGRLVAASGRGGALAGVVDAARIGVAGHSDGADTAAALAADSCCRDPRVAAAVVLAGAELPSLGGTYFAHPAPPMLFVQGSADPVNPVSASLALYDGDAAGTRYYLQLDGAGHYAPYEGTAAPEPVVARVTLDFLDRYLAGRTSAGIAIGRDGDVPGVASVVTGGTPPPPAPSPPTTSTSPSHPPAGARGGPSAPSGQ